IFIVGDEKQAIYRFQGASVENFMLLQKKWPSMEIIKLDNNYRSHQGILDGSFSMIEKNYEGDEHRDLRVRLKSSSKSDAEPINVTIGDNTTAIELDLVNRLKEIQSANTKLGDKSEKSTVAIIVRRNRDLDRIIRLCEFHGISISSERSVDIFNHPVGKIFFDLLEYLIDPSRADLLANTIISGMWGIDFSTSVDIVKRLRSGTFNEYDKTLPGLSSIRASLLSLGSIEFIVHSADKSGYATLISRDPTFVNVWRGIVALSESLARENETNDPRQLIDSLLAYRISAESRTVKVSVGAPDLPIQAMTAHGSKGLEFDYVFIPYATEETWVGRPKGGSFILPKKRTNDADIRDARRLFYVALTRARKHVFILTSLEESDGKALTPLRFIDELDPVHSSKKSIPRVGAEELYSKLGEDDQILNSESAIANTFRPNEVKLLDLAKKTLMEGGLSVTALNHFLSCPSRFLYQSILRMPQAPHVSAEKGTAMHEAISKVWQTGKTRSSDIHDIITETVNNYFINSLLSVKEKELAKSELLEDAPIVAKALETHFSLKGKSDAIFTEIWIKTSIKTSFNGLDMSIPIHGKLDAVLDSGNEVQVFDYKTKLAMSVNAIKGETKNSDGSYFRQLIFYKILVSSDLRFRNRKISPALVFISPDSSGHCGVVSLPIVEGDEDRIRSEIASLIRAVWSGTIIHSYCDDAKCEWCGMRKI
ncbi:MAG: ATP-dependent DNA helicase, partial [Candidatus Taylorbacteria bacterium]